MEVSKKRKFEIALLVVLIIAAVGFSVFRIKHGSSGKIEREKALMSQLRAVRTSVALYLTLNRALPPDLKTLAIEKYTLGENRGPYLTGVQMDKNGIPIDAFGNEFSYDSKTGRVNSVAKGYEQW